MIKLTDSQANTISLTQERQSGFLPVRAWSSTVLVRTGAGGAVPA